MERAILQGFLGEGLSLEQIGKRVGKHPSTVAYWIKRHGLSAVGSATFSPKGGQRREDLEVLVGSGLTVRQIADKLGYSYSTARYWLRRYGLLRSKTPRDERPPAIERHCVTHGLTTFVQTGAHKYYRCLKCRSEAVIRRRRRVKETLVKEAGGACVICGYDTHAGALEFHHRDPAEKSFSLSQGGVTRALARCREEAAKCVLLCANCHAEVEAGVASLP